MRSSPSFFHEILQKCGLVRGRFWAALLRLGLGRREPELDLAQS